MLRSALHVAFLASGGGSTVASILQACAIGKLPRIAPVLVVASKPQAGVIEKAMSLGVDQANIRVINPRDLPRREFSQALMRVCREFAVDIIGQYGWLPQTPLDLIERYVGRMINQHPGPLDPSRSGRDFGGKGMYGRRVHAARLHFLRSRQRSEEDMWTEATAQRVAPDYDQGALLRTEKVMIGSNDDVLSLAGRVLEVEHQVQIETLRDFAEERVQEFYRPEPLIRDDELELLAEAKHAAAFQFPNG